MRAVAVCLVLAFAAPAAAQPYAAYPYARDGLRPADDIARRDRDIATTNQLSLMQAQSQTEEALGHVVAHAGRSVPTTPFNPKAPPPQIDPTQLAEIPDSVLAASNARAIAASNNRH